MKIIACKQYDDTWWARRRGVPTASEMGNLITPVEGKPSKSMDRYACQLIAELYDGNYGPQSEFATVAMKNGSIMEPEARDFIEFHTGCEIEQVGFVLTDDERFGASPDGLFKGCERGLELKSPKPVTHVQYLLDGGLPAEYKPQVHACMIVTGYREWDFVSYVRGFPKLLVQAKWDDYTDRLRDAMEIFWPKYQAMLARIREQLAEHIDAEIERKGDQLQPELRALVPAANQYEPQPF